MAQLAKPIKDFIDAHVSSFAKWDLLVFFADTETFYTPPILSRRLGRPLKEVASALDELASELVLERDEGPDGYTYRLREDDEQVQLVRGFVESIRSRDIRLQVLAHLLKKGQRE